MISDSVRTQGNITYGSSSHIELYLSVSKSTNTIKPYLHFTPDSVRLLLTGSPFVTLKNLDHFPPWTAIPTEVDGGNHTLAFTKAAATVEAHKATLDISEALAATGVRVLIDDEFFAQVRDSSRNPRADC